MLARAGPFILVPCALALLLLPTSTLGTSAPTLGGASGHPALLPMGAAVVSPGARLASVPNVSWSMLTTAGKIKPVDGAAVAYDAMDHYLVRFGGRTGWNSMYGTLQVTGKTWIFSNGSWSLISPASHPFARWNAAMAYDPTLGAIVLFGGESASSNSQTGTFDTNDTWTFAHGVWTKVTGLGRAPSPRSEASMAYDPALGGVVLFGGTNLAHSHGGPEIDTTWLFNGTSWRLLHPPVSPPGRRYASLAYDPLLHALVLFGGCPKGVCGAGFGDTWELQRAHWTNVTPSVSPAARVWASMAYDPTLGALVLVGGSGANATAADDSWMFTSSGWSRLCSACGPSDRWGASIAFDGAAGYLVLEGGSTSLAPVRGTWVLS